MLTQTTTLSTRFVTSRRKQKVETRNKPQNAPLYNSVARQLLIASLARNWQQFRSIRQLAFNYVIPLQVVPFDVGLHLHYIIYNPLPVIQVSTFSSSNQVLVAASSPVADPKGGCGVATLPLIFKKSGRQRGRFDRFCCHIYMSTRLPSEGPSQHCAAWRSARCRQWVNRNWQEGRRRHQSSLTWGREALQPDALTCVFSQAGSCGTTAEEWFGIILYSNHQIATYTL